MSHYVYIIQSEKDESYYVGYSANPLSRLEKHNNSKSGYTAYKKPWQLIYIHQFESKTEALKSEKSIKRQKSSVFIRQLILSDMNDINNYLK